MSGCWHCSEITYGLLQPRIYVNPVFESVIYNIIQYTYIYLYCSHLISRPSKVIKANTCVHGAAVPRDSVSANDGRIYIYIVYIICCIRDIFINTLYIYITYTHSIRRTTERGIHREGEREREREIEKKRKRVCVRERETGPADQKSFVTNCHNNQRLGFNYPFRSYTSSLCPIAITPSPPTYTYTHSHTPTHPPPKYTPAAG